MIPKFVKELQERPVSFDDDVIISFLKKFHLRVDGQDFEIVDRFATLSDEFGYILRIIYKVNIIDVGYIENNIFMCWGDNSDRAIIYVGFIDEDKF